MGARGWKLLRRPEGLVDTARWLFFLSTLTAWLLVFPSIFLNRNPVALAVAGISCLGLLGIWGYLYLTRTAPLWLDLGYFVLLCGYGLSCPVPAMAFSCGFSYLWFRALYGSTPRVVGHCLGTVVAIVSELALWRFIPGHSGSTPAATVLGTAPVLFVLSAVSRYLALSMFAREEAQRRDATLSKLGSRLLGITDREQIYRGASQAMVALCAATPELWVLVGFRDELTARLQLQDQAGPFVRPVTEWPFDALADAPVGQQLLLPGDATLVAAAGFTGNWLALSLPNQRGGWMLLGSPKKISNDVVVAFNSLMNQVALALRNSEAHHDLDAQANLDSLTGLMNRAAFTLAVEREFSAKPGRLALMFVDLDDFKTINDGLGHAAGDELLRHVAARMREAVRGGDLCARLGGDEFAVLLHDTGGESNRTAATIIAQRLIDLISTPVELSGALAQIGASVGVAHASPEISPELLLQRADIAMYSAKAQGKNRFQVFEPGLLQSEEQAHSMVALGLRLEH